MSKRSTKTATKIRTVETGAGWRVDRVTEFGGVTYEAYVADELVGGRATRDEAVDLAVDCTGNTAYWTAREAGADAATLDMLRRADAGGAGGAADGGAAVSGA